MAIITAANPRKKKRKKKRTYKRRRNPVAAKALNPSAPKRKYRRRNPAEVALIQNPKAKRRSNPRGFSFMHYIKTGLKLAGPVIAGIYMTRYMTRYILKNRDYGWMGYAANGAMALILGMFATLIGQKKAAALLVTGGFSATGLRILVDFAPNIAGTVGWSDYPGMDTGGVQQYPDERFSDYMTNAQHLQGMGIPELDLPPVHQAAYGPYGQSPWGARANVPPGVQGFGDYLQPTPYTYQTKF